jgi:hypothetical protein
VDDDDEDREVYARRSDPDTSHAAADSLSKEDAARLEREVATCVATRGERGATWDEIVRITGIRRQTVSPRFAPLRRKGWICKRHDEHGNIIKRRGESNRLQTVWFSTPGAAKAFQLGLPLDPNPKRKRRSTIADLQAIIAAKDAEIAALKTQIAELTGPL